MFHRQYMKNQKLNFKIIFLIILGVHCITISENAFSSVFKCKNSDGEISFQQNQCKSNETSVQLERDKQVIVKKMAASDKLSIENVLKKLFSQNLDEHMRLNEYQGGSGFTEWIYELSKFNAKDVMSVVEELWTIELAPPTRDGAYFWTVRSQHAKNGYAHNVVNIAINRSRKKTDQIVHFQVYKSTAFDGNGIGPFNSWLGTQRKASTWKDYSSHAH